MPRGPEHLKREELERGHFYSLNGEIRGKFDASEDGGDY